MKDEITLTREWLESKRDEFYHKLDHCNDTLDQNYYLGHIHSLGNILTMMEEELC